MENKVYLIYWGAMDFGCEIKGYIFGTSEDADACCKVINKDIPNCLNHYHWKELDCLNPEKLAAFLNQDQFQV